MLKHKFKDPHLPPRVVVLGSRGFVGSSLCARLRTAKIPLMEVSRVDLDLTRNYAADALAGKIRPTDVVVVAAALAPCRDLEMFIENLKLVQNVSVALSGVTVLQAINISSDAVYGDETVPITEATPTAPTTLHGAMHLAREIAFSHHLRCPIVHLRPTLLYGLSDPHNGYGPNRFRRAANKGEDIVLFGDGEERRDHLFIEDLAEIILCIILHCSTGVLNAASGRTVSFQEVAALTVHAANSASRICSVPRSGPMPHNGYRPFDISAAQLAFPDFNPMKLADGISRVQHQMNVVERT